MASYLKSAAKAAYSTVKGAFGDGSDEYKVLLLGETGSGKTSFLNLLWNCGLILKLGFEEGCQKFHHINDITLEHAKASKMESKTSDAKLYPGVQLADGLKVGIIDTPGFGDSRGIKEDERHSQRIIEALKGEEYVNCICLVINGRLSRASATLQYVLSEITAILPREVLSNVIVVFTNTADPLDLNFDPATLKEYFGKRIDHERIFYVENPYCRLEKAKMQAHVLSPDRIAKSLKKSFEETREEMTKMSHVIKEFKRVHTHHFTELYETKQQVEREVVALLMAYDNQTELERKITEADEAAAAALSKKNLHKDYRTTQQVKNWIQKKTDGHNTLCGAAGCYKNCHEGCYLPKAMGKEEIKRCSCFNHGRQTHCVVCGHHYELHYHNEVLHVLKVEEVELIDEEGKRQFEKAQSQQERLSILKEQHQHQRKKSEEERKKLSVKLLVTITQFEKLGATRSYGQVLQSQFAVVDQRLKGIGPAKKVEYKFWVKAKEELEKKLALVQKTLKEPWSRDADPETQRDWARTILEVGRSATRNEILKAFTKMARISHPDKDGGDDEHFKRVQRARDILVSPK